MASFFVDLAKQIASTFISLGLLGLLVFAFREYFKRYIDHVFKLREERLKKTDSIDLEMLKTSVPVFREILEIVYKIRNSSRDLIEDGTPIGQDRELFSECCALLTQRLYMYRLFLDKRTFDNLHRLKRCSQDFLILLDTSDRQSKLVENKMAFSKEAIEALRLLHKEMNELHEMITSEMKARVKAPE